MLLTPDQTTDRGCWISDDRVYAFLSAASHGINEIGFHGLQPPSSNSRVLVDELGAIRCSLRDPGGKESPILLNEIEWFASGAAMRGDHPEREVGVIEAAGNQLVIRFGPSGANVVVRVRKSALFTNVHGVRRWTIGPRGTGWIELAFRDTISLDSWITRGGPYGGDFLIPEPLRRKIFSRYCRSGEATPADLRPEFRDQPLRIYDAATSLRMGGRGFNLEENETEWVFISPPSVDPPTFMLEFAPPPMGPPAGVPTRAPDGSPEGTPEGLPEGTPPGRARYESLAASAPTIGIPGHPHTERFFASLPPLVASAVIREFGIPRATPGRYYSIWAWDAMVTARCGLLWGERRTALATAGFIDSHRDEGGEIPMRWTGDLLPLDTQPRGALEALLLILAEGASVESGDDEILRRIYPRAVEFLAQIESTADYRGFFPNIGFYPDLPARFGRSHRSAVTIEIGAAYSFCRLFETVAIRFGESEDAERTRRLFRRLEEHFLRAFWDGRQGFLRDAIDLDTGAPNASTPIFSLLLLGAPAGISLLRPRLDECAEFIARRLLTPAGIRTLPLDDPHFGSEPVAGAWYPHWDQYAAKILRRAGRSKEILLWLGAAERALALLGACPELLRIDQILDGTHGAWTDHGSTSNLNCATGWYEALLAGLVGWEVDRGGVTIVPLSLPIGPLRVNGIVGRRTTFDLSVEHGGPVLEELLFDGHALRGTAKLPLSCYDGGRHRLEIRYGVRGESPRLLELINGEISECRADVGEDAPVELVVRTYGQAEAVLSTPGGENVALDGIPVESAGSASRAIVQISEAGDHRILISPA